MTMVTQQWVRVALGMFLVAFGANIFAPMVLTYQLHTGLSMLQSSFVFGIYALGIMVALFVGGPLSDSRGRRAVMRPALIATVLGSVTLLFGWKGSFIALMFGRLIIGVAVGLAMSSGASWIKELSPTIAIGARRSSVALSMGFALSPLFGGFLGQFFWGPTLLPFITHLALALGIIPLAWGVASRPPTPGGSRKLFPTSLLSTKYIHVAAYAPWVFGCATTTCVVLPNLLRDHTNYPIFVAGVIGLLTMGTGATVQRIITGVPASVGMIFAAAGMGLSYIIAVYASSAWTLWLLPVAAMVLGTGYGITMVNGLAETQRLAPDDELGSATGVFYSLTYLGFFAPFILSFLGPRIGYPFTFIVGVVVALCTAALIVFASRSSRRA